MVLESFIKIYYKFETNISIIDEYKNFFIPSNFFILKLMVIILRRYNKNTCSVITTLSPPSTS